MSNSVTVSDEERFQVMPDLDAEAFRALKQDIAENGIIVPITVDSEGSIIDGYHRWTAAEQLDIPIDDRPIRVRDGLETQEKRSLAYRLNMQRRQVDQQTKKSLIKQRLNELIENEIDKTDEEIADELACDRSRVTQVRKNIVNDKITKSGENVNVNNFTTVSDYATTEQKDRVIKDLLVENPEKSNRSIANQIGVHHTSVGTKRKELSEVYQPELHNTDVRSLFPRIESNTFDLIVTDPPYGVGFDGNRYDTAEQDALTGDEDTELITSVASELSRVLKDDRHAYICCHWDSIDDVMPAYTEAFDSVDTVIVWDKDKGGHGMGDLTDWAPRHELILKCSNGSRELMAEKRPPNVIREQDARFTEGEKQHPTEKPLPLFEKLVSVSTEQGELVFDPFGGVYTTATACVTTARRCLSVEKDTDYHATGRNRVSNTVQTEKDDRTLVYDVEVIE